MNTHNVFLVQPIRLTLLALAFAGLISGCSGSRNTDEAGTLSPPEAASGNDQVMASDETLNTEDSTGADPQVQNSIPVSFNITVPVYQSSELRLELAWGDISFIANWVGDEHWMATSEFPIETENLLVVTFFDRNGGIELARASQQFRTGSNSEESVRIAAEEFDADLFDTDEDGVSNLAELMINTDPLVDEDALLEIRDTFHLSTVLSVSQSFEAELSDQRPYVVNEGEFIPFGYGPPAEYTAVSIDADGNGTSTYTSRRGFFFAQDLNGTRTHTDNSILWEGRFRSADGDYNHVIDFRNEVIVADDTTRKMTQIFDHEHSGFFTDRWASNSDLTGTLIAGTSRCLPNSGTVSLTHWTNRANDVTVGYTTSYTAVKDVNDQYWRVTVVDDDNHSSEYFARELRMGPVADDSNMEATTFICDFVDIP